MGDSGDSTEVSFFSCSFLAGEKIFKMNIPDRIIKRIPKQSGNIPVPGIRKVPIGIFKEKRAVIAPKINIKIPGAISS